MKRSLWKPIMPWWILVLLGLLAFSGCNFHRDSPIKIGLSVNLSGEGSSPSEDIRDGALLAVDEINREGGINGHRLELIIKDDGNSRDAILKADKELLDEGCKVIFGHTYSQNTLTAYPFVTSRGAILFTAYTATNRLTGKDDLFIRTSVDDRAYGEAFSRVLKDRGADRVAFILDMSNSSFSMEIFTETLRHFKGHTWVERLNSKEKIDWHRVIRHVLAFEPQVIILVTEVKNTGLAAQKLRYAGYKGALLATLWAHGPNLIRYGGKAVNGIGIVTFLRPSYSNEKYKAFERKMLKIFDKYPSPKSARAYEAIYILADAFRRCKDPDNVLQIKEAILSGNYENLLGRVRFDRFGDVVRPLYEVKVENGQFVLARTIEMGKQL